MMTQDTNVLYTLTDAGKRLRAGEGGFHPRTIRRWIDAGVLDCTVVEGRPYVTERQIQDFLRRRENGEAMGLRSSQIKEAA